MNTKVVLEINQLSVAERLLKVSEQVFAGEQIHILGANGAGKSSLLAALSGFSDFSGQIQLNGMNIRQYSTRSLSQQRAYLTQQVSSIPVLKTFQYIELFLPMAACSTNIFDLLCADFQLTPLLNKPINQLSGGEWQRVRISAVFLQVWSRHDLCGKIILFDEPTNNLDIIQQSMFDKWIKYFCDCAGTVIMSGHNLTHSYKNASRIWMIKKGLLVASGHPQEVMTEANLSNIFMSEIKLSQSSSNRVWQIINFDDK